MLAYPAPPVPVLFAATFLIDSQDQAAPPAPSGSHRT